MYSIENYKDYTSHSESIPKKRSVTLHSQKSWRCRFFLRKHNKKTGRKHLFLSMSKNPKNTKNDFSSEVFNMSMYNATDS